MSGQFPHNQAGGVPVPINNFSTWNQSPHQQSQGRVVSPGTPQGAAHGMLPQPHVQSPSQGTGSPPKAMKFSDVAHNGAGVHIPASVNSQNPQTALSDNLRNNFQMYVNQNQKFSNSPVVSSSAPTGSVDLSHSPRSPDKSENKPVSPIPHQLNKNHTVVSTTGMSGSFNGDVHSKSPIGVSVVANTSLSPSKSGVDAISQSGVANVNHGVIRSDSMAFKREPQADNSPGRDTSKTNDCQEPPLKKVKGEDGFVMCANSSVTVGSVSSVPTGVSSVDSINSVNDPSKQPIAPVSNTSSKQDAMDVESQLEALFAGIADDGNSGKESKPLTGPSSTNLEGTPNVAAVLESKGSASKKGKGKTNGVAKSNDHGGTSSTESTPKKKRKKKMVKPWEDEKNKKGNKGKASKGKYVKEASCDSGSNTSSSRARGPVVHIEGTKEDPTLVTVVNAPSRVDDDDNDSKKKTLTAGRVRKIHNIEGKLSTTGLCGNSLISRYEAQSADPRWVCVFCKKGCHIEGLGDLFGPYLVNHDSELESSLDLEADMERKNGDKKDKKSKRSGIGQTGVLGLLAIPPLVGEQPQFMVYFHEYCAVWSPSINLIGSRLAGVQEAVWVAVRSKCSRCSADGANIGCVQHGCSQQVHYPCARDIGWSLDEDTFISSCHVHKKVDQTLILPAKSTL